MRYGRYEVVNEIGRGSMGVVYQAYDPQIGRQVALKVLREDRLSSEDYIKRFLNEATAVGRLSHRSIVTIYDIGQDHGTIYIAMELLEGTPLDELPKQQIFKLEEILKIGRDVSEALHYAHKRGIVHRDIKPANIIRLENGDIKVTDFGIAHIEDPDGQQLTQAGEILGTPVYMSPEQVIGQPVDGRSDIYSLGVILYELATGRRPFQGENIGALFNAITNDEVIAPDRINRDVPAWFSGIIMKALAREPARRYANGEDLVQDIDRTESTSSEQREENAPRTRKILAVILTVLLIISATGWFYLSGTYKNFSGIYNNFLKISSRDGKTTTADKPLKDIKKTDKSITTRQDLPKKEDSIILPDKTATIPPSVKPTATPTIKKDRSAVKNIEIFSESAVTPDTPVSSRKKLPAIKKTPDTNKIFRQKAAEKERKARVKQQIDIKPKKATADNKPLKETETSAKKKVKTFAVLKMQSNPQGAEVYIDDQYKGKTPSDISVTAEKHEVVIRLKGHGDWKAQLDLAKGGEIPLSIKLLPR